MEGSNGVLVVSSSLTSYHTALLQIGDQHIQVRHYHLLHHCHL